jgi:7-keto-8-aminopelargonate synthetase-like enzyme
MKKIVLEGPTAEEVTIQGKVYLYFGGTNYLGMSARAEVAEGARRAISLFGLSSSASRTSTGTNRLHLQVESALSQFGGTEDAIILSSGYLAMQSLVEGVLEKNDFLLLQSSAHPSIQQAARLTGIPCREFDVSNLAEVPGSLSSRDRVLVIAEGVSSLTGAVFPLPEMLELLEKVCFKILIDDAHGLGVAGEHGKGTADFHCCASSETVACATLSKAFGAFGGCILSSREIGERIRSRSFAYICASPPSAADLGAALASIQLVSNQPDIIRKLHRNVYRLKEGLSQLGFQVEKNHIPIIPIVLDSPKQMMELSERLFESGILAPYLNYPGSPEGGLIRLAVTASHTNGQIDRLLDAMESLRGR